MCGLTGVVRGERSGFDEDLSVIARRMADTLVHRGPDDHGVWESPRREVALGHRRLSIVDLSPAGHQPMTSRSRRFTVAFNGEIYNHQELREALAGPFRGDSDTEVLLELIDSEGGLSAAVLERIVGMFAVAVWDEERRIVTLARDRMGEKPLHYARLPGGWAFASELRALRVVPGWTGEIDPVGLELLLREGYVSAPHSIHRGVHKLAAGCLVELTADRATATPLRYWGVREAALRGAASPWKGSDHDALDVVAASLQRSLRGQMVADVPLGAFLSGGIDSSLIVAEMQRLSTRPVRTFTIGFDDPTHDEAQHARAVAAHLGTDHTELTARASDALEIVPRLGGLFDEPFGDFSIIPTYLVSRLTRQHVTVSLSGDAGDELFAGYPNYAVSERLWRVLEPFPLVARQSGARALRRVLGSRLADAPFGPRRRHVAARIAHVAEATDEVDALRRLSTHWSRPPIVGTGRHRAGRLANEPPIEFDVLTRMQALDAETYLPEDIMTKVDRASMAVSLECRAPFLDHRFVELALRMPRRMKVRGGTSKWALRQLLYRRVPRELVDRPKQGFSPPLAAWLRGPLRDWAEAQLSPARLRREGHLEVGAIRRRWDQHLRGTHDWKYHLWDVLSFQSWLEASHHAAL